MFDLFGKKKKQQQLQVKQLMGHHARVMFFAKLFSSGRAEPFKVYDVKVLGAYTKNQLATSIKLWIKTCEMNPQMAIEGVDLAELMPKLAQFQEGVGSVPLGINPYAIAAMDPKTEMARMQATCVTAKMPDAHLSARIKAERERLRREVAAVTGQVIKKKSKKINFDKFFVAPGTVASVSTPPPPAIAPKTSVPEASKTPPAPVPEKPVPTIHTNPIGRQRLPLGLHRKGK